MWPGRHQAGGWGGARLERRGVGEGTGKIVSCFDKLRLRPTSSGKTRVEFSGLGFFFLVVFRLLATEGTRRRQVAEAELVIVHEATQLRRSCVTGAAPASTPMATAPEEAWTPRPTVDFLPKALPQETSGTSSGTRASVEKAGLCPGPARWSHLGHPPSRGSGSWDTQPGRSPPTLPGRRPREGRGGGRGLGARGEEKGPQQANGHRPQTAAGTSSSA